MTSHYQFGVVDAQGTAIGARAASPAAEQQTIVGDVRPPERHEQTIQAIGSNIASTITASLLAGPNRLARPWW
jgi:hypothetical protein